jgi:hypothetical protein
MKLAPSLLISLLLLVASAQTGSSLRDEMAKLNVHTALLVPSQAIDEFPVWSPDSRFLAANVQGNWFKLDTTKVELREATWHAQRIGVVRSKPKLEALTREEAAEWAKLGQHGDRKVKGESGVRAEMQHHELSSSLVVSQGSRSSVIWKSDLENCGALSLSPNTSYLAYICETNGVLVMDVERVLQTMRSQH